MYFLEKTFFFIYITVEFIFVEIETTCEFLGYLALYHKKQSNLSSKSL